MTFAIRLKTCRPTDLFNPATVHLIPLNFSVGPMWIVRGHWATADVCIQFPQIYISKVLDVQSGNMKKQYLYLS